MNTVREIISAMHTAAPPGQRQLDDATLRRLRELTGALVAANAGAAAEHARFLAMAERGLCLPEAELDRWLDGAAVLVTGGTGCIGSVLLQQLAARRPGRLVSVSRGVTTGYPRPGGVEYLHADIRDRQAMDSIVAAVRPDVIFHVAAQRDPGLAEIEVHRTATTNILGTRNVLHAALTAGVRQVVCASTGKALRPYSPDMYTASKRAAEWLGTVAAESGDLLCSAARFTHVVDNSIIYRRLLDWAGGGVIRLHSAGIAFYTQSALESAQLLLVAGLGSRRGEFRVHAIRDLGWPVSLLDLAVGVLGRTGSATPIYLSGYDRGYEEVPFPGLYDPATAGDVSPLLNGFEAGALTGSRCAMADAFRLEMAAGPRPVTLLAGLAEACSRTGDPAVIRAAVDELSWAHLDATLQAVPGPALSRAAAQAGSHQAGLPPQHQRLLAAIRGRAGRDGPWQQERAPGRQPAHFPRLASMGAEPGSATRRTTGTPEHPFSRAARRASAPVPTSTPS